MNIKKKKKRSNVSVNGSSCLIASNLVDETKFDVDKKICAVECTSSVQIQNTEISETCEELSSKAKKTSKQRKRKVNLNDAENSDCKEKEVSEQLINKENVNLLKTKDLGTANFKATNSDKDCESPEQKEVPKKHKKRSKRNKVAITENSVNSVDFCFDKSDQELKIVKKRKKTNLKQFEQSVRNSKCEEVKLQINEEKSGDIQAENIYKRLSKSKRRRIRKKRILAALGLTGSSLTKSIKSRKRKSNTGGDCNERTEDCCSSSENVFVKSLSDEILGSNHQDKQFPETLDKICKKELLSSSSQHKTLSPCKQVEGKPTNENSFESSDKTADDLLVSFNNFKDGNCALNSSLCYESSTLQDAGLSYTSKECIKNNDKKLVEIKDLPSANVIKDIEGTAALHPKREEVFTDKVNIPNFLSHDNVEGLFRSALLNDITLSSRCSEKEVKNFFNTYGTFSEKNRTQFAEVEKLLLSSNKLEDTVESPLFESEKSVSEARQEKSPFDLENSCLLASNSETSLEADRFSYNSNETIGKHTEGQSSNPNTLVYSNSCSSSSGGLNISESVGLSKSVGWGPIYTSPNPENKVISSVHSPQIQCESKISLSPLVSNFGCPLTRPEKSESRLLEIVENVLLVHERVREQLTSEKKLPPQRYSSSLSGTDSLNSSESKEDLQEKNPQTVKKKSSSVNSVVIYNNSKIECEFTEQELQHPLLKFDQASNSNRVRPLHECISTLVCEGKVSENNSLKAEKTDIDSKMQKQEKTKEEVKAEREAKKLAKMARKVKAVTTQDPSAICVNAGDVASSKKGDPPKPQDKSNETPEISSPAVKVVEKTQKIAKKEVPKKESADATQHPSKGAIKTSETEVDGEILKSKAELKAERRAKQEAQRAAKAFQQQQQLKQKPQQQVQQEVKPVKTPSQTEKNSLSSAEVPAKTTAIKLSKPVELIGKEIIKPVLLHKVKLFNHLYVKQEASVPKSISATSHLHPSVVRLGVQYATKVVVGSNARCLALLGAIKQVIGDYKTPPQKEFSRGLEAILQPSMAFLQECRPLSVSMTNAIKHIKWQMRHLPNNISDVDAKRKLQEAIDTYIREQIEVAGQAISNFMIDKISNGDVIVTYGCSSLLLRILINAHKSGTKFKVVVVDARPWREGKEMLRRLVDNGLHCSYVVITAASFIMREATTVLLGAHALLANGYVMSRAGSSQVALLAHSYNVPVLVCCETHKFSERVLTDSIVYNELGAPEELVTADSCSKEHPLSKWKSVNHLTPLNIIYDVTPSYLVSGVITELSILPCTSVPVILRMKPTESGC